MDKPLHPYRSICISLSAITQSSRLHWTLSHSCRHERPRRKFVSRYILPLRRRTTSQVVLKFLFTFIENCRLSGSGASKRGDARCWRKKNTHTLPCLLCSRGGKSSVIETEVSGWLELMSTARVLVETRGVFKSDIYVLRYRILLSICWVCCFSDRTNCMYTRWVCFLPHQTFCRSDFWNNLKAKSLTSVCCWRKSEHLTVLL